jgi:UDP-N-acetylglucosamine diphosphorylase / glucose-1-phosphate thymidylyltransferase / UDP-N-acetylgalactosamine diphosphorylase / glucosamine-1-phosphate N-acetyltransferase / galactosamine-1-phosphate N-acetyltransferase
MQAVILAAGLGTRLMPFTANIHKVLLSIGDRPLLEHSIVALSENGVKEIFLVVNHRKEQIERHFGDGSKFGAKIEYLYQENPKGGTADAVRCADGKIKGNFLLLNGDIFYHPSIIKKMIDSMSSADGSIACKEVSNPQEFGILEVEDGKIVGIFEKSQNPPSNLANLGIYMLPEKIFDAIKQTNLSKRGEYEITDSIQILIDSGLCIRPVKVEEFWIDVGRIPDYERAQELFKEWKNGSL